MNAPAERQLIVLPEGHDRRQFIGGSDAGAIFGYGAKYDGVQQTPYTVYLKKVSDKPEELDPEKEKFFRRRKSWEGPIVDMLREEFDAEIVSINHRYIDPEISYFAAEIDFEWRDPTDGSIQNGEIKTVSPFAFGEGHGWGEAGTDEVPAHYAAQCMHGLGVTGRRKCILAALVNIDTLLFYSIERDDDVIASMRAACIDFWEQHVLPRIPPDPQTWDDAMSQFAKFNGRPVDLDEPTHKALYDLQAVRANLKALEGDEERLKFQIAEYVCKQWNVARDATAQTLDSAELRFNGATVGTWKKQRGSHLDQKRLRADHPALVSSYMKEHWFRPIKIK